MEVTKHSRVMKALVEEVLRRHGNRGAADRQPQDVQMALRFMEIMMKGDQVYGIADSARFIEDFNKVTTIKVQHIHDPEYAFMNATSGHVIMFHTGARTDRQQAIIEQLMDQLRTRPNLQFWHVGVWH